MQTSTDLRNLLARIDRKGYPAYKDTRGAYQFPAYVLSIDHVQGDPFAAPSKLSIHVNGKQAGFPRQLYQTPCRRIALQDALTRQFGRRAAQASFQAKGSGHSGLISISRCGQEVLERTACALDPEHGDLLLRLEVGFPANGRWRRSSSTCCPGAWRSPCSTAIWTESASRKRLTWQRTSRISAGSCPPWACAPL